MRTLAPPMCGGILCTGVLLALAACGGGRGIGTMPAVAPSSPAAGGATVRFTIRLPRRRHHVKGRPAFVSPSTQSAAIAVNTSPPVVMNVVPGSSNCSGGSCTLVLPAPIGPDTFAVTLYDKVNGGGLQLAAGSVAATIVAGKANLVQVVCDGVIAALTLNLAQPNPLTSGVSQSIALSVSALDPDGNTIVSPGGYDNGAIAVTDSDTAHTQLQIGSSAPASSVTLDGPGQPVSVIYDGSAALTSATFTASVPSSPSVVAATATLTPVTPQITVDTASGGPAISQDLIGANLPAWTDNTQSYQEQAFASAGLHLVRWPGGSFADDYHWANGGSACNGAYFNPSSTFDAMMTDVAVPAGLDVAITLNYGSNIACNGPGDPAEAAAWVAYAKNAGYTVRYWTVGNEDYGSWEYDLHTLPNDPTTYAAAVAGTNGYYNAIKAADPNAKVGIVVGGPAYWGTWDTTVLPGASGHFDFVEYHYYAQQGASAGTGPGDAESDSYILGQGITDFANSLQALRTEMTNSGVATSVPIYLGELNSIVSTAGKQTVSITNGLFAGMAMAEAMKQPGVTMGSWWLAFGDCETAGNMSSALYGFQNFGSYALFSDQSSGCGTENTVASGTPFPDGRAYALLSQFAGSGSVVRNVTLANSVQNARVYADTLGSGYGLLLFNLSQTASATYVVQLTNTAQSQFTATQIVYGKAQYDQSQSNIWTAPASTSLGNVGAVFSVTLPPWSMNLVTLQPQTPRKASRP